MAVRLLDRIYDAALDTSSWPDVFGDLARAAGVHAVTAFVGQGDRAAWIACDAGARLFEAYVAQGWMTDNARGAPMIAERPARFITDTDYRSLTQIAAMPVYRDFFTPRGLDAGAGMVCRGFDGGGIAMTLEGFADHGAARAALPRLDALRPHLARALSLAQRLGQAEAATTVAALTAIGAAAAVTDAGGRLLATNPAFAERLGERLVEGRVRLHLADPAADRRFAAMLAQPGKGSAILFRDGGACRVLHLVPLRRGLSNLFSSDGLLLIVTDGREPAPIGARLAAMFGLTPAEARTAEHLAQGLSLNAIADIRGVSLATVRTQLRTVFAKTGTHRQSELVGLLIAHVSLPIATDQPDHG